MNLINDSIRDALCEQVAHEIANASMYLCMSAFLKNKGLDNLAKHFESQHEEEMGHAKEFVKLLTDLSTDVYIPEIDHISTSFATIIQLAEMYLNREILTTKSIDEIKKLAIQNDNPVVEEKMREMISKQQHEYEEATSFLDNALLCGEDWWKCKVWNDAEG